MRGYGQNIICICNRRSYIYHRTVTILCIQDLELITTGYIHVLVCQRLLPRALEKAFDRVGLPLIFDEMRNDESSSDSMRM